MKAIKETVGNATIVIQTMDEKVELIEARTQISRSFEESLEADA